nr:hypothetical protein [Tanacetum cinerariifolium]
CAEQPPGDGQDRAKHMPWHRPVYRHRIQRAQTAIEQRHAEHHEQHQPKHQLAPQQSGMHPLPEHQINDQQQRSAEQRISEP